MIRLIIYATGEIEITKYCDGIFKFYNSIDVNNLCLNYCEHMNTYCILYNYTANYLINILNNTTNFLNNICGDVYMFKVDENRRIISFSNDEVKDIMELVINC